MLPDIAGSFCRSALGHQRERRVNGQRREDEVVALPGGLGGEVLGQAERERCHAGAVGSTALRRAFAFHGERNAMSDYDVSALLEITGRNDQFIKRFLVAMALAKGTDGLHNLFQIRMYQFP